MHPRHRPTRSGANNPARLLDLPPGSAHGMGEVPQHGGLRQKTCPRCNGRGWVRANSGAIVRWRRLAGRRPLHILFVHCGGAHSSPVGKGARQVNHRERGPHRCKPLRVGEKRKGPPPGGGWRPSTGSRRRGNETREVSMRVILRFSIHHTAGPRSIRWNTEAAGGNCLAGRNTLRMRRARLGQGDARQAILCMATLATRPSLPWSSDQVFDRR